MIKARISIFQKASSIRLEIPSLCLIKNITSVQITAKINEINPR